MIVLKKTILTIQDAATGERLELEILPNAKIEYQLEPDGVLVKFFKDSIHEPQTTV